jgi:hypothetical protein
MSILTNDILIWLTVTNDRPDLSSERAPHTDKTATFRKINKYPVMTSRQTNWLTVSCNVTLTAVTVAITPTGRQPRVYSSDHRLAQAMPTASSELPRPAPLWQHLPAANTARTRLGKNLCSTSHASCLAHVAVTAKMLGQLPTHCLPNPACCHPSAPAFGCTNSPIQCL